MQYSIWGWRYSRTQKGREQEQSHPNGDYDERVEAQCHATPGEAAEILHSRKVLQYPRLDSNQWPRR